MKDNTLQKKAGKIINALEEYAVNTSIFANSVGMVFVDVTPQDGGNSRAKIRVKPEGLYMALFLDKYIYSYSYENPEHKEKEIEQCTARIVNLLDIKKDANL